MIRHLSPIEYRVTPWKNGGGQTTEIAVDPDGAGWNEFSWRIAIAEIRGSGPFSSFPGIDRSILLLETSPGTEMDLEIDGRTFPMRHHQFVDFAGEASTEGLLHGMPEGAVIRDFNVMSRRGVVSHRRGWHPLGPFEQHHMGGTDTRFVYVAGGSAELINAPSRTVVAGESLVASGADTMHLVAGEQGAQLVWVVFSRN